MLISYGDLGRTTHHSRLKTHDPPTHDLLTHDPRPMTYPPTTVRQSLRNQPHLKLYPLQASNDIGIILSSDSKVFLWQTTIVWPIGAILPPKFIIFTNFTLPLSKQTLPMCNSKSNDVPLLKLPSSFRLYLRVASLLNCVAVFFREVFNMYKFDLYFRKEPKDCPQTWRKMSVGSSR